MIVGVNTATIVIQTTGLVNATTAAEVTIVILVMNSANLVIDLRGLRVFTDRLNGLCMGHSSRYRYNKHLMQGLLTTLLPMYTCRYKSQLTIQHGIRSSLTFANRSSTFHHFLQLKF